MLGGSAGVRDAGKGITTTTGTTRQQEETDMLDPLVLPPTPSMSSGTWFLILIIAMTMSTIGGSVIGISIISRETQEYKDTVKYYELKGDANAKATVDKILKDLRK
jgi:hypothetical protein